MNDHVRSVGPQLLGLDGSRHGSSFVRGSGFLDGMFLDAAALAARLDACVTEEQWLDAVARTNGCFAAITLRGGGALAAVDRIRSIPVFYSSAGGAMLVSDSAHRIRDALGSGQIDPISAAEFRLTGYVTGAQTLDPAIRQIEAGCALIWRRDQAPESRRFHSFKHADFIDSSTSQLVDSLDQLHGRVFRRLLDSTDGRGLVVPLSGGYDSRLIGVMLRDLGARDVTCYTYGVPGNWEAKISRELATYLGFRWEFVEYSAQRWRQWSSLEPFGRYLREAGNLTSTPHVQDWPAVHQLKQEGRIAPDAVFVPGHSGDFLAGSHVPKHFVERDAVQRQDVLDAVHSGHYALWDWPPDPQRELRRTLDGKIECSAGTLGDGTCEQAADAFERWDLQERQAKFICNAVRVYDHFGHEWRLPLFDHELMDFWARIPVELRVGRRLYFEFVQQRQRLPVTRANLDQNAAHRALIRLVEVLGLRSLGKRAERALQMLRWRHQYDSSHLAWYALIDRDYFRRTYTGREILHAYMARAYLDWASGLSGPESAASAIDAFARQRAV